MHEIPQIHSAKINQYAEVLFMRRDAQSAKGSRRVNTSRCQQKG